MRRALNILSIGGSDPSSGAGVQGDIRVLSSLGAHCATAITAITAQGTSSYSATHPLPARAIRDQVSSVLDDMDPDAIKVGMLHTAAAVRAVASAIRGTRAPVVVDPVLRSTTGGTLMRASALPAFRSEMLPLADALTPNLEEAEAVSGRRGPDAAARAILGMGCGAVVVTGLQCGGGVCDHVYSPRRAVIRGGAARHGPSHGGGCAHSAALAFALARGGGIRAAARMARALAESHMEASGRPGRGIAITGTRDAGAASGLGAAIAGLCAVRGAHLLVPECQVNFVAAPPGASLPEDMIGVRGRIVRAGDGLAVAGRLERGASRHVAPALAAMRSRFPQTASCANIRRSPETLRAMRALGLSLASYDRSREPRARARLEGTTVAWGVRQAIARRRSPPDIVHHAGAHGKEPMALVFGESPGDVLRKVGRIAAAVASQHKLRRARARA